MEEKTIQLPYKIFRGFKFPKGTEVEFLEGLSDYEPREGQVFIVTYPKCGTTWMQHIVYLLLNGGKPAGSISEVISSIPFPEQDGFPPEGIRNRQAIKSHLPLHLLKFHERARYIYVARNPKDTCVSYYNFLKKLPGYRIKSFSDFFDAFVEGELPYGNFEDHFDSWFHRRRLPNILFVTYESLFHRRKDVILEVANFMGLRKLDDEVLESVLKYSSFEHMKDLADRDEFMLKYLKRSTRLTEEEECDGEGIPTIMRKGVIGDWRNYFSRDQSDRLKIRLLSTSAGIAILEQWKEEFEPWDYSTSV